jgi:lipoprotein-anchoring transpeptidase ErfK/SrfK
LRLLLAGLLGIACCGPLPAATSTTNPRPTGDGARVFFFGLTPPTIRAAGTSHPVRSLLNVTRPMRYGDSIWNEAGVAAGPIWVRIDLHRQILSVFRGGNEIGTAVILYGADAKPTPRGRFPILAMLKDHRSSLYDAVMPYTLRLTGDGVAIHGSNVRARAATHGCIGVPTDFARHLFGAVHVGDIVTID